MEGLSPEQERSIRAGGLDPDQDYRVTDFSAMQDWPREHPEWAELVKGEFSYESSIIADAFGAPTPDHWTGMTIEANTDNQWSVVVTDDEGNTYHIPFGETLDLAWDFYDVAGFYDVDRDKDIDTGGTE